jgi:hypothetical protein
MWLQFLNTATDNNNTFKMVHKLAICVSTTSCCLACVIVFVHWLDMLLDHNSSIAITVI